MKTFLVPTDFSEPAMNAAEYALQLAKYLEANIALCNAFLIPAQVPTTNFITLPAYDYDTLKKENIEALEAVAKELRIKDHSISTLASFHPMITSECEAGGVVDVITQIAEDKKVKMVVMGMTGASAFSRFFLGSISRSMIDQAGFPLLLIPAAYHFKKIKAIAFATSLDRNDIEALRGLASFARYFDAELMIVHVSNEHHGEELQHQKAQAFVDEVNTTVNYEKISLKYIAESTVQEGISKLADHEEVDLLVMVHHPQSLFDRLFTGSHTHTAANQLQIPLLVMPAGKHPVF